LKAACVIGWPVEHSRSPLIHNYWISELGLDAEYRREAVPPAQFAEFTRGLSDRGYVGANVTVPHKEAALALSAVDARARAIGAVNTLWLDNGTLRGGNTDVEGFLANLDAAAPGWEKGLDAALLLGAGGAARAVAFALIECGVERIFVVNRNLERAKALREQFGPRIEARPFDQRDALLAEVRLLVNATSLGMAGAPSLELTLDRLPAAAVVADIVYVPLETPLLGAARQRGLRTVDGLGMLLHQAVGGFARWFGVRPEVTRALRTLVETDLIRQ
jgi:shikimate dehydrogenase